jgi:hypothetical protein
LKVKAFDIVLNLTNAIWGANGFSRCIRILPMLSCSNDLGLSNTRRVRSLHAEEVFMSFGKAFAISFAGPIRLS